MRGIADVGDNRGAMTLDYDKDGDLDIVLINHFWQNEIVQEQ